MRIKPESWTSSDSKRNGPGTRADRASDHAAARIEARHAERDYFGRPIIKPTPTSGLSPAAAKRVQDGTVRLDAWLVANGHAPSRDKAKALIAAGNVRVGGSAKVKASTPIAPTMQVEVLADTETTGDEA